MSGIYVHIPFCKQACHYCNFHFSTTLKLQDEMVEAICNEIDMQKDYLQNKNIESIYFGGGTPSLLSDKQLKAIMSAIDLHFTVSTKAEITLEANPDDLSQDKLKMLKHNGINRLSIGIQSFFDSDLEWMNRSHNTMQSHQCLEWALKEGFNNMSIDLIFGSPSTSDIQWKKNLELAVEYGIRHLSCYGLTVEEGTALEYFIKNGKSKAPSDQSALQQFEYAMSYLADEGYIQYEISNYCFPGSEAVHNSNYWKQKNYLGIGPSAHSFNGHTRQWNIANNVKYINALADNQLPSETELLSPKDRFNEYLLTGLRTIWGCDINKLHEINSAGYLAFKNSLDENMAEGYINKASNIISLTQKAKPVADGIISSLFITE